MDIKFHPFINFGTRWNWTHSGRFTVVERTDSGYYIWCRIDLGADRNAAVTKRIIYYAFVVQLVTNHVTIAIGQLVWAPINPDGHAYPLAEQFTHRSEDRMVEPCSSPDGRSVPLSTGEGRWFPAMNSSNIGSCLHGRESSFRMWATLCKSRESNPLTAELRRFEAYKRQAINIIERLT
jgi:hypothetical protein